MIDASSVATSISVHYGVPLETFVSKFTNMKFEPAGLTDDPDVRMSQSIMDYTFRRLALDYLDFDTRSALGIHSADERQRYLDTRSHQPVDNAGTTAADLVHSEPAGNSLAREHSDREGEARGDVTENASVIESPSVSGDSRKAVVVEIYPAGSRHLREGCGCT